MKHQFAVGDKVRMSDEYLATLSAPDRAELQGTTYTVESTREFHGTQMVELSGGMSTSAGWLTTAYEYDIDIADHASQGIKIEAENNGITHMREIGRGYSNGREGDNNYRVVFYALPDPKYPGNEYLVADTNGDPVWQEQDAQAFAELAEECGVEIN